MVTQYFVSILLATAVAGFPHINNILNPSKQIVGTSAQVSNSAVQTAIAPANWILMPDGVGHLHWIDTLAEDPIKEILPFNGEKNVKLFLYTRKNPKKPQLIKRHVIPSHFNGKNPTRIVIHGWTSSAKNFDHFRKAYLATGKEYNIVLLDWSGRSATRYMSAKSDATNVGKYLAEVVMNLVENGSLSYDNLYILGHSLGAHAAGVAGYKLDGKVAAIVGMDPAAPLYGSEELENRLDPTDAQFVQGIHASQGFISFVEPFGTVDFFPNGGSSQPGCGIDFGGGCSHGRSNIYYAESITSKQFIATSCENYTAYSDGDCSGNPTTIMGEWTPHNVSGSYYLDTNNKPPFAKG